MTSESGLYGQWHPADKDVVVSVVTANLTIGGVEADAFKAERIQLVDENTTVLELRHIETGALFQSTWTYVEEKNG